MEGTNYITYEQAMTLIGGAQRPASRSLASEIGAMIRDVVGQTGVDGHISLGDVLRAFGVTGFYTIVVPTGMTGVGLIINVFWPDAPLWDFTQLGLGLGAVVGSWLGGKRLADDYRFVPPVESVPQAPSNSDEYGLKIAVAHGTKIIFPILLPAVKRVLIRQMVKDTAHMYFDCSTPDNKGADKNFSKRALGKPWGDHLSDTQQILKECGHLVEAKNRTHLFTREGRDWLADYY